MGGRGEGVISPALHRKTTAQRLSEHLSPELRVHELNGIGLIASRPPGCTDAGLWNEALVKDVNVVRFQHQ